MALPLVAWFALFNPFKGNALQGMIALVYDLKEAYKAGGQKTSGRT